MLRRRLLGLAAALLATVVPACSRNDSVLEGRPFEVHVPPGYSKDRPAPLLVVLHGYSFQGKVQSLYLGLDRVTDPRGIIYVAPDGTKNSEGKPFWNATDACCAPADSKVDDSAYLAAVIGDIRDRYNVDRKRIFVLGHSNGGFMAYRMACDHAALIAGIVSLEGAMYQDDSKCHPSEPVSVVEVHGTDDNVIRYAGGTNNATNPDAPPYPSAQQTVQSWVTFDHCDPNPVPASPATRQLLADKPPAMVTAFGGCADDTAVELWTQPGGGHVPKLDESFTGQVVDFLLAHPKS